MICGFFSLLHRINSGFPDINFDFGELGTQDSNVGVKKSKKEKGRKVFINLKGRYIVFIIPDIFIQRNITVEVPGNINASLVSVRQS